MRFHIFLHAQYKSPYQEFCESINLYDSKSISQYDSEYPSVKDATILN